MEFTDKHALVLGLGESGLAMARWLAREGAAVRVADSRQAPPNVEALRAAVPGAELVAGAFGDEIDHPAQCRRAIERRGRALDDLDLRQIGWRDLQ